MLQLNTIRYLYTLNNGRVAWLILITVQFEIVHINSKSVVGKWESWPTELITSGQLTGSDNFATYEMSRSNVAVTSR